MKNHPIKGEKYRKMSFVTFFMSFVLGNKIIVDFIKFLSYKQSKGGESSVQVCITVGYIAHSSI